MRDNNATAILEANTQVPEETVYPVPHLVHVYVEEVEVHSLQLVIEVEHETQAVPAVLG